MSERIMKGLKEACGDNGQATRAYAVLCRMLIGLGEEVNIINKKRGFPSPYGELKKSYFIGPDAEKWLIESNLTGEGLYEELHKWLARGGKKPHQIDRYAFFVRGTGEDTLTAFTLVFENLRNNKET